MNEEAERAFSEMYLAEYSSLVSLLSYVARDSSSAEEIAQEAFIALYVHWRRVSRYDKPGAWLRKVAIRDAVRARRRPRPVELPASLPGPNPQEPDLDLRVAVSQLPLQQRTAVVLHYLDGRSAGEIAYILRCSESTVRVHLHRARKALALKLRQENPDVHR